VKRLRLAALAALAALPVEAQQLTMGVGSPVTSLDPHFHNFGPNNAVASMLFGTLLDQDENSRLVAGLAEAWRPSEDGDGWVFTLRPGVRFHDGTPLTSEDIAFTIARVPSVANSPGSFSVYSRQVTRVDIIDARSFRLRTGGISPVLPVDIAQVPILSRRIHREATPEGFNAGTLAVGTGPWRFAGYRSGDRLEVTRNDDYWGPKPHWQRVSYRIMTNDATRVAALQAGDVDFISEVPTGDIARLRRDPRFLTSEKGSLRFVYVAFDHLRDGPTPFATDHDGRPLARNPMRDARVRRALSLAIDRKAITERVMEAAAIPSTQFMPPGAYGYDPATPVPDADPDQARRLLAEAGYPQGFRLTLHGSNDRYVNDARIVQAIAQMWTRIGVRTTVDVAPYAAFITRASRQEFTAFFVSWGSASGEPSAGMRATLGTYGPARGLGAVNRSRYSNPAFDTEMLRSMQVLDAAERERVLQAAMRMAIVEDAAILPIHFQVNLWAMRRGLRHEGRADERTRPQDVAPAQ
jgi:peptide/nickel transport system substrate-binding protein